MPSLFRCEPPASHVDVRCTFVLGPLQGARSLLCAVQLAHLASLVSTWSSEWRSLPTSRREPPSPPRREGQGLKFEEQGAPAAWDRDGHEYGAPTKLDYFLPAGFVAAVIAQYLGECRE